VDTEYFFSKLDYYLIALNMLGVPILCQVLPKHLCILIHLFLQQPPRLQVKAERLTGHTASEQYSNIWTQALCLQPLWCTIFLPWTGVVAQAVECLLFMCEVLSSDPNTTKTKQNKTKTSF
jgi:hypothetical protein